MDFTSEFRRYQDRVELGIDFHVPLAGTRPSRLHAAMRYSLEAGGKRLRPVLVLAAAELCGAPNDAALPAAVAIECVHTYSLIHDDLPCMDNDDFRRGRPTAHKAFDEATALLAGDALLTHAFAVLSNSYAPDPALANALVQELAATAGSQRLIGGQMEDLLAEKKTTGTAAELEFIHLNKTAAMIETALVLGGLVGLATAEAASVQSGAAPRRPLAIRPEIAALRAAGRHLGLAFQIIDDVLDATSDRATLGKTPGKDARAGKTTYVALHGIDASRGIAQEHTLAAIAVLRELPGNTAFMTALVDSMATRVR
ncbi:MAG: hypothetical protein RIQ93_1512 [Verrucomicrobiota bacterium]|jgi:geranylgeranyl pyrophosphate synthase